MRLKKVTSEKFYRIKELGKVTSAANIAPLVGLSNATVCKILNHCEEYEDYLDFLKDYPEKTAQKLRDMNLRSLTGEPLFWRIHSDCRAIPNFRIVEYSNLSLREVKAMKAAEDYEQYINPKGAEMPTLHRATSRGITKVQFDEVKRYLAEGESPRTIADTFAIDLRSVERIARFDNYEQFRGTLGNPVKKDTRSKFAINDGVVEIIRAGYNAGLTTADLMRELPYSYVVLNRIKNDNRNWGTRTVSKEKFEKIRNNPALYSALARTIRKTDDYYTWSLRKYAGVNSVSWWNNAETQTDTAEREKLCRNAAVFRIVKRGVESGVTFEEIAKAMSVSPAFVEDMAGYDFWQDYFPERVVKYTPQTDEKLFDIVKKAVTAGVSIEQVKQRYPGADFEKAIVEMSGFQDYADYIIYLCFNNVIPKWLEEPKPVKQIVKEEFAKRDIDIDEIAEKSPEVKKAKEVFEEELEKAEPTEEPTEEPKEDSPEDEADDEEDDKEPKVNIELGDLGKALADVVKPFAKAYVGKCRFRRLLQVWVMTLITLTVFTILAIGLKLAHII